MGDDTTAPAEPIPTVEWTYNEHRREFNLLLRRPFYLNLLIGRTQNAVWLGPSLYSDRWRVLTLLDWRPWPWNAYSETLGRVTRSTLFAELRHLSQEVVNRPLATAGLYVVEDIDDPDGD